jgi:cystathionine beta-lyase
MTYDFDQVVDRSQSDSIKWRLYGEEVLPLWVADMDFRSPEPVIRALHERVEHGVFGYGVEPPELREVVVAWLQRSHGWQVAPEALVFLPGVATGYNLACRAVAAPGDGVLVQTPIYPPILLAPPNAGLTVDQMELTRRPDGTYGIDFDAFEAAITERTRLFILCSPHNPVGRVFQRRELERMAEICLRHGIIICSDEIHSDLVFRGSRHIPIASLSPEVAARTITLIAPTKTFNIAGLKCSAAIVESAELRDRLCAAKAGLVAGVSVIGYVAALAAYRDGRPWLEELLHTLEGNRDFLLEYVVAHLPGVGMGRPEGTYLAWLDCRRALPGLFTADQSVGAPPGGRPCSNLPANPHELFLQRARVALNDGQTFGRGGEGFVRLNFGCPRATLAAALDRMRQAMAEPGY